MGRGTSAFGTHRIPDSGPLEACLFVVCDSFVDANLVCLRVDQADADDAGAGSRPFAAIRTTPPESMPSCRWSSASGAGALERRRPAEHPGVGLFIPGW
jgi:hypothetical protein